MENIRRYIETVYGEFESFEQLAVIREECICLIANKLLTMDSTNKELYAKMISKYLDSMHNYCSINETYVTSNDRFVRLKNRLNEINDFDESNTISDEEDIVLHLDNEIDVMVEFIFEIEDLFNSCDLSLNDHFTALQVPSDMIHQKAKDALSQKVLRKKLPSAKATEQVDVITTLLNNCNIKYSNDKDLSEFISWLCGGSAESIRQNGIIKNTGYNNEKVLKEKFASIGITYDKGKINNE